MKIARWAPDLVLAGICITVLVQGNKLSRRMDRVEQLDKKMIDLANGVYSFARRVDRLEDLSKSMQDVPITQQDTAETIKAIATLEYRYCRAQGRDGVQNECGTIFVGEFSPYGCLLSCGPGWARFETGYYILKYPA